jgi:hypothetical protein
MSVSFNLLTSEAPVPENVSPVVAALHGLVPSAKIDPTYPLQDHVTEAWVLSGLPVAVPAKTTAALKAAGVHMPSLTKALAARRAAIALARNSMPRLDIIDYEVAKSVGAVGTLLKDPGRGIFVRGDAIGAVDRVGSGRSFRRLTSATLAAEVSRHALVTRGGKPIVLPEIVSRAFLDAPAAWDGPVLAAFSRAPIVRADGSTLETEGFDEASGVYVYGVPKLDVPDTPTKAEAQAALLKLRNWLATFAYADRPVNGKHDGLVRDLLDTSLPPAFDETAALALVLTAVVRPSIDFAPAFVVTAPDGSGSRTGKGCLVNTAATVAHGAGAAKVTWRGEVETEKTLAAELMTAPPVLMLDNANGVDLHMPMLDSILTERSVRIRVLTRSENVEVYPRSLITATGNGLTVRSDMAVRCIPIQLDARVEEAGVRKFAFKPEERAQRERAEVLGWALTVIRWGRQNEAVMSTGKPMGGFEEWTRWVRDPLLTLGCPDLVERVLENRRQDTSRNADADFCEMFYEYHGTAAVEVKGVNVNLLTRLGKDGVPLTKQQLTQRLRKKVGTRAGGWLFERIGEIDSNRHGSLKYRVTREDGLYPDRAGSAFPSVDAEAEAARAKPTPGVDLDLEAAETAGTA